MSGPASAVLAGNSAFFGGSLDRSKNPVAAQSSFSGQTSSGGDPAAISAPGAPNSARNNRGSNVRIPYARVVPCHQSDRLEVRDANGLGTDLTQKSEYDDLQTGECCWVLSKAFGDKAQIYAQTHLGADLAGYAENLTLAAAIQKAVDAMKSSAQRAAAPMPRDVAPMGFGVDRMQRLGSTNWVESLFRSRLGHQSIDLTSVSIGEKMAHHRDLDSDIKFWSTLVAYPRSDNGSALAAGASKEGPIVGASLFAAPDLAYGMQVAQPGHRLSVQVPAMQGLFCMEQGAFLRSYGCDSSSVEISLPAARSRRQVGASTAKTMEVDRHLGSQLAQKALLCEFKKRGLFNWTPDGIVLSKLANGPDGTSDAEYDARSGMLFNVGVQGPCITSSWCGRSDMQVLPMDRVFMLIVASLDYVTETVAKEQDDRVGAAAQVTANLAEQRFIAASAVKNGRSRGLDENARIDPLRRDAAVYAASATGGGQDTDSSKRAILDAGNKSEALVKAAETMRDLDPQSSLYQDVLKALQDAAGASSAASKEGGPPSTASVELSERANELLTKLRSRVDEGSRNAVGSKEFKDSAEQLRSGRQGVKSAVLSNFRIMRATSSFLANTSHFDAANGKSRCGLPIGYNAAANSGSAEYIVGGWCIGTVVDSAASRATSHNGTRTAPASMAININVNVEFWDADQLYSRFQDKDRGIYTEKGQHFEGTVHPRNVSSNLSVAEKIAQRERSMSEAALAAADKEKLATDVKRGVGDFEGSFKHPVHNGVDSDATGVGVFDRSSDVDGGEDPRRWGAVLPLDKLEAASKAYDGVLNPGDDGDHSATY